MKLLGAGGVPPGLLMWTMTALALEFDEPLHRLDALPVAADQTRKW